MDEFIGIIKLFAGNFAPRGWAFCHGQLLAISQNTALFSILGTTYGGDGITTFALPDLRSRVPAGAGNAPGLSHTDLGEMGGSEAATLSVQNMPIHNHRAIVKASNQFASGDSPSGRYLGMNPTGEGIYDDTANTPMGDGMVEVGMSGGSQPFSIRQPYLGLNYIISLQGIYPSRD